VDTATVYEEVQRICYRALDLLPRDLVREVDETIVFRPLGEDDLHQIFELEITHYQQAMFPGQALSVAFEGDAKTHLFDEAKEGLGMYGAHALRRVLQRYIDPVVYRAYNDGALTEENLTEHTVLVSLEAGKVSVRLE
jgi:ATP-dependent Clp protease ATP-binding subunit ClpA